MKDGSSSKSKGKSKGEAPREESECEEGVGEERLAEEEDWLFVADILIVWMCFDVVRVNNGILGNWRSVSMNRICALYLERNRLGFSISSHM